MKIGSLNKLRGLKVIKHSVVGVVMVLVLTGCEADKNTVAREKIDAIKQLVAARSIAPVEASFTQLLIADNVNRCIVQMAVSKAKLDAIQIDYAETQTVQSLETRTLHSNINDQLTTCLEAKQSQGY
ncbi:hypothetical protein SB766_03985 [Pseudomonas sp. SIMBA_077]